jgi:predicted RNA-binding Zn-ribbon protein involved in translation (DUF1610 family)
MTNLESILRERIRREGRVPILTLKAGVSMFACPQCGRAMPYIASFRGKSVRHNCPRCRKTFHLDEGLRGYTANGLKIGTEEFERGG